MTTLFPLSLFAEALNVLASVAYGTKEAKSMAPCGKSKKLTIFSTRLIGEVVLRLFVSRNYCKSFCTAIPVTLDKDNSLWECEEVTTAVVFTADIIKEEASGTKLDSSVPIAASSYIWRSSVKDHAIMAPSTPAEMKISGRYSCDNKQFICDVWPPIE